jgi:hypothetical protein
VVTGELVENDVGTKGSCGVETAAGEEYAGQLGNEESETYTCGNTSVPVEEVSPGLQHTDWRDERSLVLLSRQHEDREHELRSQEHLNEKPLCDRSAATKGSPYIERTGKHARDQRCRSNTAEDLDENQQGAANPGQSTDQAHAKCDLHIHTSATLPTQPLEPSDTYSWVKQPTADSEKYPRVHSQRKPKAECDVLQLLRICAGLCNRSASRRRNSVGDLRAG